MKKVLSHKNMGTGKHGWLNAIHHFSFADYYNPSNVHFGVLRVMNDDIISPNTGFPTHPHKDMEIITYIIEGQLTHADSMGHDAILTRGEVQYMSAGTGVTHSEYNSHPDKYLRLLQIWIFPDDKGHKPQYGDFNFKWEDRINKLLHIVSNIGGDAPIQIHQDINMYAVSLTDGNDIDVKILDGRQAYIKVVEGDATIADVDADNKRINIEPLEEKDAIEVSSGTYNFVSNDKSKQLHLLIIEMAS